MKFVSNQTKEVKKFQMGGPMAPEAAPAEDAGMPAEAPAGDPNQMMQAIIAGAEEAVQNGDGELALQVCGALLEMTGGGQGAAPQEAPVYQKCGGKMKRKSKK